MFPGMLTAEPCCLMWTPVLSVWWCWNNFLWWWPTAKEPAWCQTRCSFHLMLLSCRRTMSSKSLLILLLWWLLWGLLRSPICVSQVAAVLFDIHHNMADTSFYAALDYDHTESFTLDINTFITKMFKDAEIGKRCFQYLLNTHSRPGRFYLLPKIHKNVLPPPGRPIISAIGSPTEKISEFLDHFLQPFLADMPSFVKDTGHFLYILSKLGPLPQNIILVTLDVTLPFTPMYPSYRPNRR